MFHTYVYFLRSYIVYCISKLELEVLAHVAAALAERAAQLVAERLLRLRRSLHQIIVHVEIELENMHHRTSGM